MSILCIDNRIYGQPRYYLGDGSSLMLVPEVMRKAVVFLGYDRQDGSTYTGATAFFVSVPVSNSGYIHTYLVTAKHAIRKITNAENNCNGKVVILGNDRNGGTVKLETRDTDWISSGGEERIDISVCDLENTIESFDALTYTLPKATDHANNLKSNKVGIGDEVFLTGLFKFHKGKGRNVPVLRTGNISLMPDKGQLVNSSVGEIEAYLVEIKSTTGLSGSPVFIMFGDLRKAKLSRGAPKPASAGRSKPASVVIRRIPHPFESVQLSVELAASVQSA